MTESNSTKRLLIGYWPLLDHTKFIPGAEYSDVRDIFSKINVDEIPPIEGVLWVQDNGNIMPVFIMKRAKEVADHLIKWIEGDNDRFSLHIDERGDSYAIVLIPSVEKSINRWKLAHLMYNEEFVTGNDFVVYYHTLGVYCPSSTGYKKVRGKLGKECHVGFIDASVVDRNNMQNSDFDSIVVAGPFKLGPNDKQAMAHLDDLFNAS